jgi:signal transduction histidine kinase
LHAQNELEYMVGVSVDRGGLHSLTTELEKLSCDLNTDVAKRSEDRIISKQLAAQEDKAAEESSTLSEAMMKTMSIQSHRVRIALEKLDAEKTTAVEEANAKLHSVTIQLEQLRSYLNTEAEERTRERIVSEALAEENTKAVEEANARSEAMIQTMSILSHELRTPLQVRIRQYCWSPLVAAACQSNSLYFPSSQGIVGLTSMALLDHEQKVSKGIPLDETAYENNCTIQASSQLLLSLINNMLDLRKMESGMMEKLQMECFDLAACIRLSQQYVKPLTMVSGVTLDLGPTITVGGNLGRGGFAMGAPLRVQQVLLNLIGNAVKYSSTCSLGTADVNTIEVNVRRSTVDEARQEAYAALCSSLDTEAYSPRDHVLESATATSPSCPVLIVDIRDHGDGIPVDEAHKLFAAFVMLKKHANKSSGFAQPTGSGLGLQLCSSMIEAMGGCIWANNCHSPEAAGAIGTDPSVTTEGGFGTRGCIFSFYLKCPHPDEVGLRLARELRGTRPEGKIKKLDVFLKRGRVDELRVLVVDDTLINIKVLCRMLKSLGLTKVRSATSAMKAMEVSTVVP